MLRVAAATPRASVGDASANAQATIALARQAHAEAVDLVVFPELNLTSSSPPTFSSLYIRLFFFVQSLLNLYKPLHSFDFPAYSSYAYIRSNGIVYHLIPPCCIGIPCCIAT